MLSTRDTVRLLIVDDEPDFAETAAAFLEREDDRLRVETVSKAEDALERLEATTFDCIVSDYDMPGRDGIEFLEAVREEYPDLPLILFTGKGSEEVASDAISAGVTDYLQKNGGTDQYTLLANRVQNAVEARQSVTEAKRRRHRLEQILKTVPSCVVQLDRDGRFVFANQRAVDVLGLSQSAVKDRTYNDPEWGIRDLDGNPIPDAELPFRQVFETGAPLYDARHKIRWPNGAEKVLSVNGAPLFDDDGAVESVVCTLTDMTGQRERKRDLQETQRRLQLALEGSETGIWEWDCETNEVVWNDTLEQLMGFEPGEFDGTLSAVLDLIHPEDRPEFREQIERAVETDSIYDGEFRFIDCDGDVQWGSVRGQPVEYDGSALMVGVHHDITERKERERELEVMQRRLEAILENTTAPMFMKDDEGRYIFVNHGYREMIGLADEEIVGRTDYELFPEAMADTVWANDRAVLQTGQPLEVEERIIVDGEPRQYLSTKVPIYDTGERSDPDNPVAVFGVASNITDIRNQEQELQRERDRLAEFASVVSHDLRSPLSVAQGRLKLARKTGDESHLAGIETALDRMERIIDDVLLLARQGRDIQETELVSLRSAVTDAWEMVSQDTEDGTLVFAATDERDVMITADRPRLLQLLENLLRNSVEHGSTSRPAEVDDSTEHGSAEPPSQERTDVDHGATSSQTKPEDTADGEGVTISIGILEDGFYVADDGPGVSGAERGALFEAGYSTDDDGTGFGLAIVDRIAEAHGWTVGVTDSADGGARFEITGVEFA
ncbi:PAS domain S-box-containing protein [Haloarcula vallismortis]|uniref:histidine kinase n=2 Tax=Haloarcula vallismortis TaxID=28442 RepID=M0JUS1_HALVA|nr:PAS domain S-box protein [Haloarcula vallismortis]EMA11405.1 HTR-like protein [Haloarcula vallismortis ATCC 29715]SDW40403.1 PAS domain S-box-containing protein [Haloarcula vallismortis]